MGRVFVSNVSNGSSGNHQRPSGDQLPDDAIFDLPFRYIPEDPVPSSDVPPPSLQVPLFGVQGVTGAQPEMDTRR